MAHLCCGENDPLIPTQIQEEGNGEQLPSQLASKPEVAPNPSEKPPRSAKKQDVEDGSVDHQGNPWYPLLPLREYWRPKVLLTLVILIGCQNLIYLSGLSAPSIYERFHSTPQWRNPPAADEFAQLCYDVGLSGFQATIFYVGGLRLGVLHGNLPQWFPRLLGVMAFVVVFAIMYVLGPMWIQVAFGILLSIFPPFILCNSGRRSLAMMSCFVFMMQLCASGLMVGFNNILTVCPDSLKPFFAPSCAFLYKTVWPMVVNCWWYLRGKAPAEIYPAMRIIIVDTSDAIAIAGLLFNVKDNLSKMMPTAVLAKAVQSVITNCLLKILSCATGASLVDLGRRIICGRPLPKPTAKKEVLSRYFLMQNYTPALLIGPYWMLALLALTNSKSFAHTWVAWTVLLVNNTSELIQDICVTLSQRAKLPMEQRQGLFSTWQTLRKDKNESHSEIDSVRPLIIDVQICGGILTLLASAWPLGNQGDQILRHWLHDPLGLANARSH